jgi:hypothetical protein
MTRVLLAAFPPGVTVAGENEHLLRAGSPEQDKETGRSKLLASGVTSTVKVPDWPWLTVKLDGLTAISTASGIVTPFDRWFRIEAFPTALT